RAKTEHGPKQKRQRRIKQNRIGIRPCVVQDHGARYHQAKKKDASFQSTATGNSPPLTRFEIAPSHNRGRESECRQDVGEKSEPPNLRVTALAPAIHFDEAGIDERG